MIVTSGMQFNHLADGGVNKNDWGTLTIELTTCNQGIVTYNSSLGFAGDSKRIDRLTNTAAVSCTEDAGGNPGNTPGTGHSQPLVSGDQASSPDNQTPSNSDIVIDSSTLRQGSFFGGVPDCVVDLVATNHAAILKNVVIKVTALSGNNEVGFASVIGNIQPSQTVTLEAPFLDTDQTDEDALLQCSEFDQIEIEEIRISN